MSEGGSDVRSQQGATRRIIMLIRLGFISLVILLGTTPPSSVAAQTADPARASEVIAAQISKLREAARARDSLSVLADSASGASREFLDELIAQRDEEVHDGVISLAEEIESDQRRGADVTGARALVAEWLHGDWPLYANQLERRLRTIVSLGSTVEQVTGPERLAI